MLIIHRLSAGTYRYFTEAIGPELVDAPGLGEAPGRWWGAGAEAAGLGGRVERHDLAAALRVRAGRVPGFDLTFAAPKSVSVLHGLGDAEVEVAVRVAHDRAVDAGLAYLERHACAVRRSGSLAEGHGLTVAAFRHRVSRADEPHLHTHALVANRSTDEDGQRRALHTPLLHAERRGAGAVYHAVLRDGLSAALGLTWGEVCGGRADAEQVPEAIRRAFSSRRAAVLADAAGAVTERRWSERITRPERDGLVDIAALAPVWRQRAADLGWSADRFEGRSPSRRTVDIGLPDADRWTRSDLTVAIVDRLPSGAPAEAVAALTEAALRRPEVRDLGRGSGRQQAERFTTDAAMARRRGIDRRLGDDTVEASADALDRRRRALGGTGHRLLVVAADERSAVAVGGRTGALAVPWQDAPRAVERLGLGAGDEVVVLRPSRLPSAGIESLAQAVDRQGVRLCGGDVHTPAASREVAAAPPALEARRVAVATVAVATVAVGDGSLTGAATAAGAADVAIEDWLASRRAGRAAVLVGEGAEVDELNRRARAALRAAGLLAGPEVGGLAAGDAVWFPAARPAVGIGSRQVGVVSTVDGPAGRVRISLGEGRDIELGGRELANVRFGHAVPPLPALLTGSADLHIVGGRELAGRHLRGHVVHRYLTVDAGEGIHGPGSAGQRWAGLDELRHRRDEVLTGLHLPSPVTGDLRRLAIRDESVAAWLSSAEERGASAMARGDGPASEAWAAQRRGALLARDQIEAERRALTAREVARSTAVRDAAPVLARVDALATQQRVRVEVLVGAAERAPSPALVAALGPPPGGAIEREEWRAGVRLVAPDLERGGPSLEREPIGLAIGR